MKNKNLGNDFIKGMKSVTQEDIEYTKQGWEKELRKKHIKDFGKCFKMWREYGWWLKEIKSLQAKTIKEVCGRVWKRLSKSIMMFTVNEDELKGGNVVRNFLIKDLNKTIKEILEEVK